jgi:hypothetical protein
MQTQLRAFVLIATTLIVLAVPGIAGAYVGPGAGLTVIGAAFAFVASLCLAVVGFVWYPLKKLWRSRIARADRSQARPASD